LSSWIPWAWCGLFRKGHVANQFFRFCVVGASGVVVNAAAYWVFFSLAGINYLAASVLSYVVASVNNFVWNKLFTFDDNIKGLWPVLWQYFQFLAICTIGMGINLGVLYLLVEYAGMNPNLANLLGVLVATGSNFIGNKFVAFKKRG